MRVALALLVLFVPTACAGVAVQSDVAFQVPAQLDGATAVRGGWALLHVASGDLDLHGSTALRLTNHTTTYLATREVGSAHRSNGIPHQSEDAREIPGVATRLHAHPGAALWVKAKQVTVTFHGASTIGAADADTEAYDLSGTTRETQAAARNHDLGHPTAYVAAGGLRAAVQATGVEAVEWSAFDAACRCLPAGGRQAARVEAGPAAAGNVAYSSIELLGLLERASFEGEADALFVGGAWLEVDVEGTARLPLATPPPDCPRCLRTENRTLWAEGRLALSDMVFRDRRTLGASFHGDLVATRLDERPVDPHSIAGVPLPAVLTAGVVGTVAGSVLLLLGLLTRYSRDKALTNANRRGLYEAIVASPGIPFRELVRASGVAAGTARYHLTVLIRAGLVVERSHHNLLRFYENHGKHDADWARVGLLREPALRELHEWLQATGPIAQKDILSYWEMRGWSRSTTQHRLRRFERDRLVEVSTQGRCKMYEVAPPPGRRPSWPPMPAAAPSA